MLASFSLKFKTNSPVERVFFLLNTAFAVKILNQFYAYILHYLLSRYQNI